MSLRVLSRRELATLGAAPTGAAQARWRRALAPPSGDEPPLVSLLDDWGEFADLDWPPMLRQVFDAHEKVAGELRERRPETPEEVAAFYDETDTLIPLLLWWHATDTISARCASCAVEVMTAAGARRVLDFGCGIGSTALALAEAGFEVTLSEVARTPLEFAEWRLRRRGREPRTIDLLDSSVSDLEPNSFDGAVAFDVLEHLPDIEPSLEALHRALAPGGIFCFNQVYVPSTDGPHHYPQCGEALVWLHRRGYRLAHVTPVCWIAQKAKLPAAGQRAQGLELRGRILAARAAERYPGPLAAGISKRVINRALH